MASASSATPGDSAVLLSSPPTEREASDSGASDVALGESPLPADKLDLSERVLWGGDGGPGSAPAPAKPPASGVGVTAGR
jgi:hypothetical protein